MGSQRHVAFVDGNQEGNQEAFFGFDNEGVVESQEETNYVGNQGGYNNYKPFNNTHPNLSYRSTNVENPQDQTYPTQAQGFQPKPFNSNFQPRPQQAFGQSRPNFQQQGFQPRGNFQGGFQPRGSGFQAPSTQPSQDPEVKAMFQSIMEGQARGQRENEKKFKDMETQIDQVVFRVKSLEGQVAQVASSSKPPMGTFPGKAVANPKAPCNAVLESGKAESLDEAVSSKSIQEPTPRESVKVKKVGTDIAESHENQVVKKPLEDPKEKFRRIVELVEREERLEEEARKAKEEASKPQPATTLRVLAKREDPGKFNIPVSLGGKTFEDALCDSGSYVNVISWDLVKELGLEGMRPHSTPLMFGDASKKVPKGMIEECPILVGDCIVKSDLLVLDMVNSMKQPLLLGAPFLLTTGAVIDYVKGTVVLQHVDEAKDYAIRPPHEFCGTIVTKEAIIELQETTTVETAPIQAVTMFSVETKVEVEAPSKEEAASPAVKASPGVEIKEIESEKLEAEVPLQKEATSKAVEAKLEVEDAVGKIGKPTEKKKQKKQKKLEKARVDSHEPRPPSIALKPSKIVAGKLECTVKSNGYSKPFAKARIILDSTSKLDCDSDVVSAKMASLFGIKLGDRGPFQDGSPRTMN